MSYNSKYNGQQVENLLDQVKNSITTETDPIFSASPAAKITDDNISAWNNKVDKVSGKQLSTEDFTTVLKNKLNGLSNYDDTTITAAVSKLRTDFDTLVSGDTTAAIKSFNNIVAFLDGLTDSENLDSIISSIEQQIAGKQDEIIDIETIRSGAGKGATAVQPTDLAKVATSGSYNELNNKPTIPDSLSDLTGDTTHRTVTDTEKATWNAKSNFSGSYNDLSNKPTIPSAVTESTVSGWGFTKNKGTYSKPSGGIPNSDLAKSSITISGTSVSLGGSITQSALRTALGLGSNAYSSTAYLPESGGVLTSTNNSELLTLNAAAQGDHCWIVFENGQTRKLGRLGFLGIDAPCFRTADKSKSYKLIHTGNLNEYALSVTGGTIDGNLDVTGTLTQNSSRELKNIIDKRELTLEEMLSIKPVRFTWKDGRDKEVHLGAIADEVKEVIPEVVHKQEDGTFTMEYANTAFAMVASLVKYVKQNQERIEYLESEIVRLKQMMAC